MSELTGPVRLTRGLVAALVAALFVGVFVPLPARGVGEPPIAHGSYANLDAREGRIRPSAAQRRIVRAMGATAMWNRFGTPTSLINYDGYLATGLSRHAVTAARSWVEANSELFRLSTDGAQGLELLSDSRMAPGGGHAVILRQRAGDLPLGHDGLITVGVKRGKIAYVSSSAVGDPGTPGEAVLTPQQAWILAARNVGITRSLESIEDVRTERDWTVFDVTGFSLPQRSRLVAVPIPGGEARPAYESNVIRSEDGEVLGYTVFVDAGTGDVLLRLGLVEHFDTPRWKVFRNHPALRRGAPDRRVVWCWRKRSGGEALPRCKAAVRNPAARGPWDYDFSLGAPTFTTKGNAASTALSSLSPLTPSDNYRPVSPSRHYVYPFEDAWRKSKCDPAVFAEGIPGNDVDAAIANLFAMHNRMHDWSYYLGFTEENFNLQENNFGEGGIGGDPEIGDAQAGALTGGSPTYTGRDNANQITPQDGVPPITNMYLWQPIAAGFYPPCVDGDFDMSVIGHEYTHAISNRMVGGPNAGLTGSQGRAMGEAWSDLVAVEYLHEYGFTRGTKGNPFAVGPYVTGNKKVGIRNYGMNRSPLNFSDIGYDFPCNTNAAGFCASYTQVHADGEIWSAINYDIRKALVRKYNRRFPARDATLQRKCANGKLPARRCPGNRRWAQIMFDAFLLMPSDVGMLGARDAYLAADRMRFGGANQKQLWRVFARRGMGRFARSKDTEVVNPKPNFESPKAGEARVRFRTVGVNGRKRVKARIYVGRYHARVSSIADTFPKTKRKTSARFVPGRYQFTVKAQRFGVFRFSRRFEAGQSRTITLRLAANWASRYRGATIRGAGGNHKALIDDTEATNWAVLGRSPTVKGAKVTVDLAGGVHKVRRIKVSAMLRQRRQFDEYDSGSQNRFSALRRFAIYTCNAKRSDDGCRSNKSFKRLYVSSRKAFPGSRPRPIAPKLILRGFDVPNRRATHVRLVVLSNQCTGGPDFKGEKDNDPTNVTDCSEGSAQDRNVRAAELQVFSGGVRVRG